MIDTPETDANSFSDFERGGDVVLADFARRIELERNRITELVAKWRDMPSEEMRLRAGDMTAQEIRSVKAVLNAILPNVASTGLVRPWRSMRTAPKNGMEIEVLVYHVNRRYAKRSEKGEWESIEKARWIDHNGGGWTWKGMHGQFRGWRPPEKLIGIAEKCADALLTACDGKPCQRLQLMRGKWEREEETNMGGWCRGAIIDQIVDVLMESLPNAEVCQPEGEKDL